MATIEIKPEHQAELARLQAILTWLAGEQTRAQGEQTRLQAELGHIGAQGQRMEEELRAVLQREYGLAPGQFFTLDADAGTITTAAPGLTPSPTLTPADDLYPQEG